MLPTFVIGLREGLEAALIVGIVAAFLRQRGRQDLLRWVFVGVSAAIGLCVAAGVALEIVSRDLPQRRQEGLETVIGVFAVAMVSYMVVWMRRHSRDLKGQLEGAAGAAVAAGSGWALVAMAFLAVLREGLETVVFLLAAFNENGSGRAAGLGAVLGVAVSVALGWAIYRGGVRLNLSKFFRATGIVLVLVAAGLVMNAFHTAHEAGWLNTAQQQTVNLSAIVRTGSVQASVLTGVLGLQPRPVLIELLGWLIYLVPMVAYVSWPPGKGLGRGAIGRLALATGVCLVAVVPLLALRPAAPEHRPLTRSGDLSARLVSTTGRQAVISATLPSRPAISGGDLSTGALGNALPAPAPGRFAVSRSGSEVRDGIAVDVYTRQVTVPVSGAPSAMSLQQLASLNGGRLPLGVRVGNDVTSVPVRYTAAEQESFEVATATGRVVGVHWQQTVTALVHSSVGVVPVAAGGGSAELSPASATAALQAAGTAGRDADRRRAMAVEAGLAGVAGLALLLAGAVLSGSGREPRPRVTVPATGVAQTIRS